MTSPQGGDMRESDRSRLYHEAQMASTYSLADAVGAVGRRVVGSASDWARRVGMAPDSVAMIEAAERHVSMVGGAL